MDQVKQAFEEQTLTGRRLGEIVVDHGWVSSTDLAKALADQAGLEYVDLSETEPDPAAAVLLQKDLAFRYQAVPVRFVDDDLLLVAVADPSDVGRADDLRLALGHNVRLVVSDPGDLERTIKKLYRTQIEVEEVEDRPARSSSTPTRSARTSSRTPTTPRRSSSSTRRSPSASRTAPPTSTSSRRKTT